MGLEDNYNINSSNDAPYGNSAITEGTMFTDIPIDPRIHKKYTAGYKFLKLLTKQEQQELIRHLANIAVASARMKQNSSDSKHYQRIVRAVTSISCELGLFNELENMINAVVLLDKLNEATKPKED